MTKDNDSNKNDLENAKTSKKDQSPKGEAGSQENEGEGEGEGEGKKENLVDISNGSFIPRDKFNKINNRMKAAETELEEFRAVKKEEEEAKLKKDGEFQELLSLKDKELVETKSSLEAELKNNKLEKFKNKSLNLLNKEGVIDGEDGLKFLSFDSLLDAENVDGVDDTIKKMVNDLKQNKSYLFGSSNQKRNAEENNMPGGGNQDNNKSDSPKDAFSQAFAKVYQR